MYKRTLNIDRQSDGTYIIYDGQTYSIYNDAKELENAIGEIVAPLLMPLITGGKDIEIVVRDETD